MPNEELTIAKYTNRRLSHPDSTVESAVGGSKVGVLAQDTSTGIYLIFRKHCLEIQAFQHQRGIRRQEGRLLDSVRTWIDDRPEARAGADRERGSADTDGFADKRPVAADFYRVAIAGALDCV